MRITVRQRMSVRTPFELMLRETTIKVVNRDGRLHWMWIDDTAASMHYPTIGTKTARAGILTHDYEVSEGKVIYRHFGITALARIEWACGDQTLIDEPRLCHGVICQPNRKILAWWRRRSGGPEIVLRDGISAGLQCVSIALVIGHNFS
jgi:hypothetical protein